MASQPPPSPSVSAAVTVHLAAADGATFDLTVPLPAIRRPAVRGATIAGYSVTAAWAWNGTGWVDAS